MNRFLLATLSFFGRLFRDIWLEIWRPIRRLIVKWVPWLAGALLLMLIAKRDPDTFGAVMTYGIMIGIMIYALKNFTLSPFRKKKKKK